MEQSFLLSETKLAKLVNYSAFPKHCTKPKWLLRARRDLHRQESRFCYCILYNIPQRDGVCFKRRSLFYLERLLLNLATLILRNQKVNA